MVGFCDKVRDTNQDALTGSSHDITGFRQGDKS